MKKIFTLLTTAALLSSCAPKIIALKGNYPPMPIVTNSTKSFDEVWDKLVDLFAQNGLTIKIIDRSSGLIISSGSLTATIEKKDGTLENPLAYVCVPKFHNTAQNRDEPISGYELVPRATKITPRPIFGDWNVRVKKTETGSVINVNLVGLYYTDLNSKVTLHTDIIGSRSTGVFEKTITDLIN